jgi:hypothetical protein
MVLHYVHFFLTRGYKVLLTYRVLKLKTSKIISELKGFFHKGDGINLHPDVPEK